ARAMAKAPVDRYQSTAAMQADLDAVAAGFSKSTPIVLPSGAYPFVSHETGSRLKRRIRWSVAVLGVVAVLAAVAWYAWHNRAGVVQQASPDLAPTGDADNSARVLAVLPFTNTANDPETEYLSDGIPGALLRRLSVVEQLTVRPYRAGRQKG